MENIPSTRMTLLVRLHDSQDEAAWSEFLEIYEPFIYRLARKRGFQHADAADLSQEVFATTATAIERWHEKPLRGPFRAWLFLVARNIMIDALKHRQRQPAATGDSRINRWLAEQPAADEEARLVETEYRRRLFQWAADQVQGEFRETTWRAFWLTSVEGRNAADVGAELRISVGAVYIARSRVMARLRAKIAQVEGQDGRQALG